MRLILVRHSISAVDISRPPAEWPLSEAGLRAVGALADTLGDRDISAIFSSEEPKAAETAGQLARLLECDWSTAPGLHEHERERMDWHGEEAWYALLREFFNNPDDVVFGLESARRALDRFSEAADCVLQEVDGDPGPVAIVSHGTVISLFVARQLGIDPYSIWRKLNMPDYVELDYSPAN